MTLTLAMSSVLCLVGRTILRWRAVTWSSNPLERPQAQGGDVESLLVWLLGQAFFLSGLLLAFLKHGWQAALFITIGSLILARVVVAVVGRSTDLW